MNLINVLLDNSGAIVAEAIRDLVAAKVKMDREEAQAPAVVRIIAQRIQWPDFKARPNREGLRLRWRCVTEEGEELVASTDHPLSDGAAVLLLTHGLPGDTLVTLRHDDRGYDSFKPMKLSTAAAHGIKRQEDRQRLDRLRKEKAKDGQGRTTSAQNPDPSSASDHRTDRTPS